MAEYNNPTIIYPEGGYGGEVLDHLLLRTAHSNETYQNNLIHVETDVTYKLTLPMADIGNVIQDNVPTPKLTDGDVNGDLNKITITERTLEPKDFMVFLKWYPEHMASYWKPFKPTGNLIFRELDPAVQADFISLILQKKDQYIGDAIWIGVEGGAEKSGITAPDSAVALGSGDCKYFDGVMKRALDSQDEANEMNRVNITGSGLLDTGEAVEKALYATFRSVEPRLRPSLRNMTFVMSHNTFLEYDEYLTSQTYKYRDNTTIQERTFKGVRIVPVAGVPDHTIVLGKFSRDITSNLWMAIDWATRKDEDAVKIGDISNYSAEKFFQMRLKMDVNIVKPCEIYMHTAYKKANAEG